ncbi:carboxypeptidase-like regulatory domain-containing protein [Nocardioides sp. W7]|uniref:carboxypeptidase-like regulatory domain-containing protein n=1 Tax=Nocardioides sp. W7 TaxID=2931390 RepID=UPI001FD596AF|nr:carboxypeptidase-like regulatory domain-containing protein [Nocardioides sp. W7]
MRVTRIASLAAAGALAVSLLGSWTPASADSHGAYVIGTVTGAAGRPLPGAYVNVYWCDKVDDGGPADAEGCYGGKEEVGYQGYVTDRHGRYVGLVSNNVIAYRNGPSRSGAWLVQASAYQHVSSAFVPVTVTERTNVAAPTLAVVPEAAVPAPAHTALTGLVTDSAGIPVANATVLAYDAAGRRIKDAVTYADGRYYFTVTDPATFVNIHGATDPAAYAAYNVTGSVRLHVEAPGRVAEWSGNTRDKTKAAFVPVAAYGSAAPASAPTTVLDTQGSVTGTVKLPKAGPNWTADVTVFDLDGNVAARGYTDAAGSFSVDIDPGHYYVRAEGSRYTEVPENAPDCPTCFLGAESFGFVAGYYGGGTSLATAKAVAVGSGKSVSVRTITLTNVLRAVRKPVVKGRLVQGKLVGNKKLTVFRGVWNRRSGVTYSYAWKVGKKVLGTRASLKVTKKVQKRIGTKLSRLTVTVTATDKYGDLVSGSSTVKVKRALAARNNR